MFLQVFVRFLLTALNEQNWTNNYDKRVIHMTNVKNYSQISFATFSIRILLHFLHIYYKNNINSEKMLNFKCHKRKFFMRRVKRLL